MNGYWFLTRFLRVALQVRIAAVQRLSVQKMENEFTTGTADLKVKLVRTTTIFTLAV